MAKKYYIIFFLLFATYIFLRFYKLAERTELGWDQIDSAWAAKDILFDRHLRLEGVPIKGNAAMVMGPLYYYLIVPFYFLTNFDPIASSIFSGFVGVVSFLIFFYITKKIFDINVAFIAAFIYIFSIGVMNADRVQAAFILIPIVSYCVFYFLYKIITGNPKYILYLAAAIGFGFHVHFTTIFYPIITLLVLPFFPRNKKTLQYIFLAIPIFLLFMAPIIYSVFLTKHAVSGNFLTYFHTTFHGLHLRRILQISHDAFISFETILQFKVLRPFVFLVLPLFIGVYCIAKPNRERFLLSYLMILWIVVPWIILGTYSGELTDYYFSLPRNFIIAIIAFLTMFLFKRKILFFKLLVTITWVSYAAYNSFLFYTMHDGNYLLLEEGVKQAIKNKKIIEFKDRDPASYMYHVYNKMR